MSDEEIEALARETHKGSDISDEYIRGFVVGFRIQEELMLKSVLSSIGHSDEEGDA